MREGCYLLRGVEPIWGAFGRAHRWRAFDGVSGAPKALPLDVVQYAAEECASALSSRAVVRVLIAMDDTAMHIMREAMT